MTAATGTAMVIVSGDDIHHDLLNAASVFQALGLEAGFATTAAMGMGRFADPAPHTADADVYLLYTSGGLSSPAQQEALAAAVAGGKGLVAIHCSNVLGPADRPLFELLGNRYLSHGPDHHEGTFEVLIGGDHPITRGVEDFTLFDEYYEFEFADAAVDVLATRRRVSDGAVIPVLYARPVGSGRVCYLALGHDMRAWGQPAFRTLVRQALQWAYKG
jgi:type 1 glutamine amidotransferase